MSVLTLVQKLQYFCLTPLDRRGSNIPSLVAILGYTKMD
jgi:hypothetical protein